MLENELYLTQLCPVVTGHGDLGRQLAKQRLVQTSVRGVAHERNSCASAASPAEPMLERRSIRPQGTPLPRDQNWWAI